MHWTRNKYKRWLGEKEYSLKDHLGNVRVNISDRKLATLDVNGQPDSFYTSVNAYFNYAPFGMAQPGRQYNPTESRFGFNSKESDDEIAGTKKIYNYDRRIYHALIARFWSEDPLTDSFPSLSPYEFASNTPIQAIDLNGEQVKRVTLHVDQHSDGSMFIKQTDVDINPNETITVDGEEKAATFVSIKFKGQTLTSEEPFLVEELESERGLRPSSADDFSGPATEEQFESDMHFIFKGEGGNVASRFMEVTYKNQRAPEDDALGEVIEFLETITTQ
jgi:RHS repeat-associated protein